MSIDNSRHLKEIFGGRLRALRGMDRLKDFASQLGESSSRVSNYESGVSFPPEDFLFKLIQLKRANLNWLIAGEGEMFLDLEKNAENKEIYPELAGMHNLVDQFARKVGEIAQEYEAKKAKIEARKNANPEKK